MQKEHGRILQVDMSGRRYVFLRITDYLRSFFCIVFVVPTRVRDGHRQALVEKPDGIGVQAEAETGVAEQSDAV